MGSIVWVASYPESGARWLSMFLANLISDSQTQCGEHDRNMIVPAENSKKLYQPFFNRPLSEIPLRELAEMRPTIHRELAKRANGFLFLRTHNAAIRHFGVPTITPEATSAAIYVVRNPMDIAASYGAATGRPIDRTIAHMAQTGRVLGKSTSRSYEIVGSWSENVKSWTMDIRGRILCIQFEHMLEDPHKLFSEVVHFLEMKATPEQISRATENSIVGVLQAYSKSQSRPKTRLNSLEMLHAGAANQGKKLLKTQQMATIAALHRDQMKRFGYWR